MGGYGEVWKVTAPGGLTKAMKIVYGHMRDARAEQDLKSLGRIKEVRHPFILSLERFEIIENQLVIVMELADKSLMDRFEECQRDGLPGIPRTELLGYLRDAAEALDYMAAQYGLQHLDIKPQNLLLVGGRVKLADFGLVKDLENSSASATGGITAVYATPEAFDGRVSRYSDQYSLAIVYQEMLTGSRPFPGTTPLQLAAQHSKCPPMLDSLFPQDRPVIARALSKAPDQRFPTCGEMVHHLLNADVGPQAKKGTAALRVGGPSAFSDAIAKTVTPPSRADRTPRIVPKAPDAAAAVDGDSGETAVIRVQPSPSRVKVRREEPLLNPERRPALVTGMPGAPGKQLRPTLFLGVGGIAGWTLQRLRQQFCRRFNNLEAVPSIRLLLFDTDRAALLQATRGEGGQALASSETLLLPLRRPEHYRPQSQTLLRSLDRRWLYNIPPSLLTEGARPLGRLALLDNAADVLARLREAIGALVPVPAGEAAPEASDSSLRDASPQVFLIASLSGGTGSGMVLTLAYAVQQVLAEYHLPADRLCALLVHATGQRRSEQELARLNAYAGLTELHHFSSPEVAYPGDPEHGLVAFGPGTRPVGDAYFVHLGDQLDHTGVEAATDSLAEYLYVSAATGVGGFLDEWRQSTQAAEYGEDSPCSLRGFGIHRLSCPRVSLAARVADLFCKHLVDRWCDQSGGWEEKRTESEGLKQIAALGLEAENLSQQLHAAALRVFGEAPEQTFLKILADFPDEPAPRQANALSSELKQALLKIDIFLGIGTDSPGDCRVPTPVDLEVSSQAQALADQLGRALVDWLVTLVEDPDRRLKAAAHAAKWLRHHFSGLCDKVRSQLEQLRSQRSSMRSRFAAGNFGTRSSGIGRLANRRSQRSGTPPKQQLIGYCWLRLHECVLENIFEVFHAVAARVANFSEELQRNAEALRHFGASLVPLQPGPVRGENGPPSAPGKSLTELWPGQCQSLQDAAAHLFERLGQKLAPAMEKSLQSEVLDPRGGLWRLAAATGEPAQRVKDELKHRVLAALLDATRDLDAAKLFLESRHDPAQALRDLLAAVASVLPKQEAPGNYQHLVLALPSSPEGAILRELLASALEEMPHTVLTSEDDIVLCHEVAGLPLRQVAELLLGDEAALAGAACHVLTRNDVTWSSLATGRTSMEWLSSADRILPAAAGPP